MPDIQDIINLVDPRKILAQLQLNPSLTDAEIAINIKLFEGEHKVKLRPNKITKTPAEYDDQGTMTKDAQTGSVPVNKLVINIQDRIVRLAKNFAVGGGVDLIWDNKDDESLKSVFKNFQNLYKKNKMNSFNEKFTTALKSQGKATELWYWVEDPNYKGDAKKWKVKVALLTNENGNKVYPNFDKNGDLDAIARYYVVTEINETGRSVDIQKLDIYTADRFYFYSSETKRGKLTIQDEGGIENPIKKIPLIYAEQNAEFEIVQGLIDRVEYIISRLADMNDYFADPKLVIGGDVTSVPSKGDTGTLIQKEGVQKANGDMEYGTVEYLVWKNSPDTVKFEINQLLSFIYGMTSTADISFENLKDINGGTLSGLALKFMFLDAMLKASSYQNGTFGEHLVRRDNVVRAIFQQTDKANKDKYEKLELSHHFNSILPESIQEMIATLVDATGSKPVMSQATAVNSNPLVHDPEGEVDKMKQEEAAILGGTFNVE